MATEVQSVRLWILLRKGKAKMKQIWLISFPENTQAVSCFKQRGLRKAGSFSPNLWSNPKLFFNCGKDGRKIGEAHPLNNPQQWIDGCVGLWWRFLKLSKLTDNIKSRFITNWLWPACLQISASILVSRCPVRSLYSHPLLPWFFKGFFDRELRRDPQTSWSRITPFSRRLPVQLSTAVSLTHTMTSHVALTLLLL